MSRRVVITGIGVVSPLGNSPAAVWESLAAARSGVEPLTQLPPLADRITFGGECRHFAGEIDDFGPLEKDVKKAIRKALKMMCRESMMAVAAAQQAIANAGFDTTPMDPDSSGVVFGSDYMLSPPDDLLAGMVKCGAAAGAFDFARWGRDGLREMNPLWMLSYLPNMPASHIAIFNDLRGPNNSLTMREASSLLAIREAAQTIARGHADRMVAGATGTRLHSFKTIHALQHEQLADPGCAPHQASRPFDAGRTGMVLGEGAGALLLEESQAAQARGATIYAEVIGTGSSACLSTATDGDCQAALTVAARAALAEAECSGKALGHINAHAAGAVEGDAAEAAALAEAVGPGLAQVPVVAAKSYFGNLGAGGGAVETIASLLAFQHDRLFATLNYETPDPRCALNTTRNGDHSPGQTCLKLSVTPQGQAAAVVLQRVDA